MKNKTAIYESHRLNALNKKRNCFEPGCSEIAIDSHILQKNGIISRIAKHGHVIECVIDSFETDSQLTFKRRGVNKVFTFKGFCKKHDNNLFEEIEKTNYNLSSYKHQLLFAYRTSVNETRKKEVAIDCFTSLINDPDLRLPIWPFVDLILGESMGIKDGEFTRSRLQENISTLALDEFIFYSVKIQLNDVCICGVYSFETSDEIKTMEIVKNPKFFAPLTDVFVTLLPQETNSILSIGFIKGQNRTCDEFYNNLFSKDDEDAIIQHISDLMLLQIENWIVSEQFYNNKIEPKENQIKTIINWAQENWNERISLDINLFK